MSQSITSSRDFLPAVGACLEVTVVSMSVSSPPSGPPAPPNRAGSRRPGTVMISPVRRLVLSLGIPILTRAPGNDIFS